MYFQLPCTGSCTASDYSNINLTIESTPVITKTILGDLLILLISGVCILHNLI